MANNHIDNSITNKEMFELLGKSSEHHCNDCAFRGDGEELCDDTYCYDHNMIIKLDWFCNCWESDSNAEQLS